MLTWSVKDIGLIIDKCVGVQHDRSYEVECDYLVAADGANSSLRSMLGVNMIGRHAIQHLVNIHFMASGLEEHLRGREAMLYFVFNSEVISVLVAHDLKLGEFVAQVCQLHIFLFVLLFATCLSQVQPSV